MHIITVDDERIAADTIVPVSKSRAVRASDIARADQDDIQAFLRFLIKAGDPVRIIIIRIVHILPCKRKNTDDGGKNEEPF